MSFNNSYLENNIRVILLLLVDAVVIMLSTYLALLVKFDGHISPVYLELLRQDIVIMIMIKILVYALFKLYRSLWRYASIDELLSVVLAVFISNIICFSLMLVSGQKSSFSIYFLIIIFDLILIGISRFSYRLLRRVKHRCQKIKSGKTREIKKILVVGAGDAGAMVVKEFKKHTELYIEIVGFIDDDITKSKKHVNGYSVLGKTTDIKEIVEKYKVDEIIIAMPSVAKSVSKEIVNICSDTGAKVKILPGLYQFIDDKVSISQIRDVNIDDLLGREAIKLDKSSIADYLKGKRVMVTGGGGSIGSELCRQIAKFSPREIIIVDIYENNVYDLENELKRIYNSKNNNPLNFRVIIASVRDEKRMRDVVNDYQPQVIFHAAAHKHVPLMEHNPCEAVKNNILGTHNVVKVAHELGVEKFVLISTDKAVNPTNVMGATKRFCENIIQAYAKISDTEFVAVRFGNVLGSNGSVIPLFKRQIKEGGPVTVTHRKIIRYFMTIPEAAQLVLQAGALAKGGEIFVLDMGDPVKIYDLAKHLIKLSGLVLDEDIKIEITGLREGEKLYEELLMDEEGLEDTVHKKIYIGKPQIVDYNQLLEKIEVLEKVAAKNDAKLLREKLKMYVDTYVDNSSINKKYLELAKMVSKRY